MLLFIIIAMMIVLMVVFLALVASVGGTIGIILFSDVIVCVAILAWILKKILHKK